MFHNRVCEVGAGQSPFSMCPIHTWSLQATHVTLELGRNCTGSSMPWEGWHWSSFAHGSVLCHVKIVLTRSHLHALVHHDLAMLPQEVAPMGPPLESGQAHDHFGQYDTAEVTQC